jgi:PAS domain S-box-containing protein
MRADNKNVEGPLPDRAGQLERELAAARELAQAYEDREQRLSRSLNAANVGTWEWNIPTGEVRWSPNMERIHGRATDSFSGTFKGFLEGVHNEDRDQILQAIRKATSEGNDYFVEYRSLTGDDAEIWLEGRGHVFFDEAGQAVWMMGVCMNITERKKVQQQLQQTQKMESLGLLAGGVAHDFNNLLTGILGNARMALDRLAPGDPAQPLLRDVVLASRRAADLTRQLLAFAGKSRLAIEDIEVSSLIAELIPLVSKSIPDGAQISLNLAPMSIRADTSQIQQLVMNLIINAAEAIGAGNSGTVYITTRVREMRTPFEQLPPGTYGCLEVRDTGCGMDEGTSARIFDPFFSTKFTGRGLGLAAALGIVRRHQGAITVKSTPGSGSTFTVLFPARRREAATREAEPEPRHLSGSGTILVVDDEDLVLRLAQAALAAFGYIPLAAANGPAALEILRTHAGPLHAVVLDLMMPGMNGEETLQQIRAIRPDLPVVIASGCGEIEVGQRFAGKGANGFLPKPYTARQLARAIREVLAATGRSAVPAAKCSGAC